MFARVVLAFHRACLSTYEPDSLSSIIPTLARPSRNSNHSHTYGMPGGGGYTGFFVGPISRASKPTVSTAYAKTGGCTSLKMSARRHFLSLFSQSPLSDLSLFQSR